MKPEARPLATSAASLLLQFAIQMVVGLILYRFYQPTAEGAHASVEAMRSTAIGRFGLAFHYFGSMVLIVHAAVHVVLLAWYGWYARTHRWRWWAALAMLMSALGFQITGNLLPMDRHDAQTAAIEAGIAGSVPVLGPDLASLVLQGDSLGPPTLAAWSAAHRWILPLAVLLLFGGVLATRFDPHGVPFSRRWFWAPLVPLTALALLLDAPSGSAATSADYTAYDAAPGWYVWPLHALMRAFSTVSPELSFVGTAIVPGLLLAFLVALPWLSERATPTLVRGTLLLFLVMFATLIGFGGTPAPLWGRQEPPLARRDQPQNPDRSVDQELAASGRTLFNRLPCAGCHGRDGRGGTVRVDFGSVRERLSHESIMRFIQNPKSLKPNTTMPAFPDLSKEELRALAEFVAAP